MLTISNRLNFKLLSALNSYQQRDDPSFRLLVLEQAISAKFSGFLARKKLNVTVTVSSVFFLKYKFGDIPILTVSLLSDIKGVPILQPAMTQ
jgi:hypothetical protein